MVTGDGAAAERDVPRELENKHQVLAHVSGKMPQKFYPHSRGDKVAWNFTLRPTRGRIVYRISRKF